MSGLDLRVVATTAKELSSKPFPKVRNDFRIFLAEEAFDRAVTRGDGELSREVGGVLVGDVLRDEAGPYLRVDATIDALHADEKGAEVTFTHATWEHIHKEMDSRFAGKKIVGWYHTHPGFGIFLSDRDQFIHRSFFNLPFQIALVYDPKSREHGIFAWHDNETWRCRRYWVGEREQSWDGNRPPPGSEAKEKEKEKLKGDGAAATAASGPAGSERVAPPVDGGARDWVAMIGAALLLAVIAGIGGWWWGTRAATDVLSRYEEEISRARSEGSRAAMASLNNEILALVRGSLGDEPVRHLVDGSIADLDEGLRLLTDVAAEKPPVGASPQPAGGSTAAVATATPAPSRTSDAIARIRAARDRVVRMRDERVQAYAVMRQLEEVGRHAVLDPSEVMRQLTQQRTSLGALYAELADDVAGHGDARRAHRLVQMAATIDPGNHARYEQQMQLWAVTARPPVSSPGPGPGPGPGSVPALATSHDGGSR